MLKTGVKYLMKEIKLTQGKVALVDDEDYEILCKWKWYAHKTSKNAHTFYAVRTTVKGEFKKRARVYMHRYLLSIKDSNIFVDHKDGDGLNNQKSNIRQCDKSQNRANQQKGVIRSSKYKGVCFMKNRGIYSWVSYLQHKGKKYNLGYFKSQEDAAMAYNNKAIEIFGEFAKINKV